MRLFAVVLSLFIFAIPVDALEIQAPSVPESAEEWMPRETNDFGTALTELLRNAVCRFQPDLIEASRVSLGIIASVMLVSLVQSYSMGSKSLIEMIGAVAVTALLLQDSDSMICLATETIHQITDYGKLLLPVMTAGLAAQGSVTASTALYAGSATFFTMLQSVIDQVLAPGVLLYLGLRTGGSTSGEQLLKRMGDMVKGIISWFLKIVLTIFTTYLSLTGVVSGTTDAAIMKAAKISVTSFVPIVGGILSDASEAVLVSAGIMKNGAGIYGILAIIALFLHPFLRIGSHYLIFKLTAGICSIFNCSRITDTIDAFGTAMGLLLAMTAATSMMVLISTVCFMKGVG